MVIEVNERTTGNWKLNLEVCTVYTWEQGGAKGDCWAPGNGKGKQPGWPKKVKFVPLVSEAGNFRLIGRKSQNGNKTVNEGQREIWGVWHDKRILRQLTTKRNSFKRYERRWTKRSKWWPEKETKWNLVMIRGRIENVNVIVGGIEERQVSFSFGLLSATGR